PTAGASARLSHRNTLQVHASVALTNTLQKRESADLAAVAQNEVADRRFRHLFRMLFTSPTADERFEAGAALDGHDGGYVGWNSDFGAHRRRLADFPSNSASRPYRPEPRSPK